MTEKITKELVAGNVGKKALWEPALGIQVEVVILAGKVSYGTARYTIQPVAGSGQRIVRKNLEIIN